MDFKIMRYELPIKLLLFVVFVVLTFNSTLVSAGTKYGSKSGTYYCAVGARDPGTSSYCDTNWKNVLLPGVNMDKTGPCDACFLEENGWTYVPWELDTCYPPSGPEKFSNFTEKCIYWERWNAPPPTAGANFFWRKATVYVFHPQLCGPNEVYDPYVSNADGACIPNPVSSRQVGSFQTCNPIDPIIGSKLYVHNDFRSAVNPLLEFTRHYNSRVSGWQYSFSQHLILSDADTITVHRPSGTVLNFSKVNGLWKQRSRQGYILKESLDPSGFKHYKLTLDSSVETYSSDGWLLSVRNFQGNKVDLIYSSSKVVVTDTNGSAINISTYYPNKTLGIGRYDYPQLNVVKMPDDTEFKYLYAAKNKIQYVQIPDATSFSGSNPFGEDNPFTTYEYTAGLITGVIDENGVTVSKVSYDEQKRAKSSGLAGGVDTTTVDYSKLMQREYGYVDVTNALGKVERIYFNDSSGTKIFYGVRGVPTENCELTKRYFTYYPSGHMNAGMIKTKTDWRGHVTRFEYNDRGLETQKTEALGLPEERTTVIEWHENYILPLKITIDNYEQLFVYDSDGRLLSETKITVPQQ